MLVVSIIEHIISLLQSDRNKYYVGPHNIESWITFGLC